MDNLWTTKHINSKEAVLLRKIGYVSGLQAHLVFIKRACA